MDLSKRQKLIVLSLALILFLILVGFLIYYMYGYYHQHSLIQQTPFVLILDIVVDWFQLE